MPEVIDTPARLASLVETLLQEPCIALDSESNSFHRYPERVCLVQIATRTDAWMIDPLAFEDVTSFGRLLADKGVEKVIHAADNDVRSFDREWGFRVGNVYDTSIAGRFTGMRRSGLDTVLLEGLGVTIKKSKNLQRADWTVRPLSAEAMAYAVDDVTHLVELREALGEKLESLGRASWVAEECERLEEVRYAPPDPPEVAFLFMKGSRDLDRRRLAVLRELVVFRDEEGRRRGLPPFRVLSNETLLHLAQDPRGGLGQVPGLTMIAQRRLGAGLEEALRRGASSLPVERSRSLFTPDMRPTKGQIERLKALKAWRAEHGERLDLDPALLWPMPSLERLAREPDAWGDEIASSTAIRRWQREELGESLRERLARV